MLDTLLMIGVGLASYLVAYVAGYMRGHAAATDEWMKTLKLAQEEIERLTEIVRLREMYER